MYQHILDILDYVDKSSDISSHIYVIEKHCF